MEEGNFNEVFNVIQRLFNRNIYTDDKTTEDLKTLVNMVSKNKICHYLFELNFHDLAIKILKNLGYRDRKSANNLKVLCHILLLSTDQDAVLCSKYMEVDMVEFFKDCACFIKDLLHKNDIYSDLLKTSLGIMCNISRFFPIKEKCGDTVTWLRPMLQIKKRNIGITSFMLLSHLVGDNENEKILDEEGNIGNIVEFLKMALANERRCYKEFHFMELLLAIDNLAKNAFNREQLKQCELLETLKLLLNEDDENIQEIAMNIMLTMLLDNQILTGCKRPLIEELKPIFQRLNSSKNFLIKSNSTCALAQINTDWFNA